MATLAYDWAIDKVFYHRDNSVDDDTNHRRAEQADRLMFVLCEVSERASDLNVAFHAAADAKA